MAEPKPEELPPQSQPTDLPPRPPSPPQFLQPGSRTAPGDLAIVLLARDQYEPIILESFKGAVDGYAEGAVLNTRFGSFPHQTFIDIPWGSQVRASKVDTGSRGRKRRREEVETPSASTPTGDESPAPGAASEAAVTVPADENDGDTSNAPAKQAFASARGFVHVLRPTPELWTASLPHRTQVVYVPDYSYILHRIRARPGSRLIEAGAGSGSFTHASVRAVFNGTPTSPNQLDKGKVFSFEYDENRFHKMQEEITLHKLDAFVEINHRDVYNGGFLVDGKSPNATAVFLDLPAPWKALRRLSRRHSDDPNWVSPLDPNQSVHICTFSPCIEQVISTVNEMRKLGWVDIQMVEIAHRRLNVVRDRVGLNLPKEKGINVTPASVDEAVSRLREVNKKAQDFQDGQADQQQKMDVDGEDEDETKAKNEPNGSTPSRKGTKDDRLWSSCRVVHRPEGEIKTHTSYLVFAILPQEWTDEDEAAAFAKWPCGNEGKTIGNLDKAARKQAKRDSMGPGRKKKQKL